MRGYQLISYFRPVFGFDFSPLNIGFLVLFFGLVSPLDPDPTQRRKGLVEQLLSLCPTDVVSPQPQLSLGQAGTKVPVSACVISNNEKTNDHAHTCIGFKLLPEQQGGCEGRGSRHAQASS